MNHRECHGHLIYSSMGQSHSDTSYAISLSCQPISSVSRHTISPIWDQSKKGIESPFTYDFYNFEILFVTLSAHLRTYFYQTPFPPEFLGILIRATNILTARVSPCLKTSHRKASGQTNDLFNFPLTASLSFTRGVREGGHGGHRTPPPHGVGL